MPDIDLDAIEAPTDSESPDAPYNADVHELRARITALLDENERLRNRDVLLTAVADAAGELTYCVGNASAADADRAAQALDAALDALLGDA